MDTGRYGEQDCYNIMVRSGGLDWEPEDEFVRYVVMLVYDTSFYTRMASPWPPK